MDGKKCNVTYILIDPVLIDGPDSRHVGGKQLRQRDMLVAGAGADEPGLADRCVADHHALYQLLVGLLVVHVLVVEYQTP